MKHCFWLIFTAFFGFSAKSLGEKPHEPCSHVLENPDGIDSRSENGATRLIRAVTADQPETVKCLLDNGANPDLTMKPSGWTALHFAAHAGRKKSVDDLLAAGADRDLKALHGARAVDLAEMRLAWFNKKNLSEEDRQVFHDTIRDYESIIHTLSHTPLVKILSQD